MSDSNKVSPWKTLESGQVILREFDGFGEGCEIVTASDDSLRYGCVVDVETTGLDSKKHKIIEIALRVFEFNKDSGQVCTVLDSYSGLEDPEEALSSITKKLTGISDSDVKGQKIDWDAVGSIIEASDLVIAHNAWFDRGFVDRRVKVSRDKVWGCSNSQVSWLDYGFTKTSLEMLCAYHGYFYKAHRALGDVDATLKLISEGENEPYLLDILKEARKKRARLRLFNTDFEKSSLIKERGYRWKPQSGDQSKHWWRIVEQGALEEEEEWFSKLIHSGQSRITAEQLKASSNYSSFGE
jgi:DNA polymerase-3 subunit epsilon